MNAGGLFGRRCRVSFAAGAIESRVNEYLDVAFSRIIDSDGDGS